jgi:DNA-binding CsgD family transcriptional regulator
MAGGIPHCKERQLLELVDLISSTCQGVTRIELVIDGVTALLDSEVGGFNDVNLVEGTAMVLMRPLVVADPSDAVRRTLAKQPVVQHYKRFPRDRYPQRLSDHVVGRWEDHEVYWELFKPMGTPHEVIIPLPWAIPLAAGSAYAVTRSGPDFTDKELRLACAVQAALQLLHQADGSITAARRLELLTETERELIELVGRGLTTVEIAQRRNRSVATVRTQRNNAYTKLGVHDRQSIAKITGYGATVPLPVDRLREIFDS